MQSKKSENISTMRTGHVHSELIDYIKGQIDPDLKDKIAHHLGTCDICKREYEELSNSIHVINGETIHEPSLAYFSSILPRVREKIVQIDKSNLYSSPILARIAIPVLAVFIAIVFIADFNQSEKEESSRRWMKSTISNLSEDEINDVVDSQIRFSDIISHDATEMISSILAQQYKAEKVVNDAVVDESTIQVISEKDYQSVIESLDDEQIDQFISRMKERKAL